MKYIDADKFLKDETKRCGCIPTIGSCTTDNESLAYSLAKAPTADVVEVRHGEWIEDGYNDIPCVCSHCGAEAHYVSTFNETFDYDYEENLYPTGYEETKEYIKTPYCPHCGTKMDRERKCGEEDA